jgi:hypothetical protein
MDEGLEKQVPQTEPIEEKQGENAAELGKVSIDAVESIETEPHPDLTTEEGVTTYMEGSLSEDDWNSRTEDVKTANEGEYPDFWFSAIVVSGLPSKMQAKWQQNR